MEEDLDFDLFVSIEELKKYTESLSQQELRELLSFLSSSNITYINYVKNLIKCKN